MSLASFFPRMGAPASGERIKLLLIDNVARRVFERIFSSRRIRFNQLLESEPGIRREELKAHLQRLVDEDLVASAEAPPIEDFQTYYVTRAGLTAEHQLRQIEAG